MLQDLSTAREESEATPMAALLWISSACLVQWEWGVKLENKQKECYKKQSSIRMCPKPPAKEQGRAESRGLSQRDTSTPEPASIDLWLCPLLSEHTSSRFSLKAKSSLLLKLHVQEGKQQYDHSTLSLRL